MLFFKLYQFAVSVKGFILKPFPSSWQPIVNVKFNVCYLVKTLALVQIFVQELCIISFYFKDKQLISCWYRKKTELFVLKKLIHCCALVGITVKLFHKGVLTRFSKGALKNNNMSVAPTIIGRVITYSLLL